MSFSQEMRDFTGAMNSTADAYERFQRGRYYASNRGKGLGPDIAGREGTYEGGGTPAGWGQSSDSSGDGGSLLDRAGNFVDQYLLGGDQPAPSPATVASQRPTSVTPPMNTGGASSYSGDPNTGGLNTGGLVTHAGKPAAIPLTGFAFGGSVTGGRVGARPLPRAYSPSPVMQGPGPAAVASGAPVAAASPGARRFAVGGPVDNDPYPDDYDQQPDQTPPPPPPPANQAPDQTPATTPAQPAPTTAGAPPAAQPAPDTSPATTPPPPPPPAQPAPTAPTTAPGPTAAPSGTSAIAASTTPAANPATRQTDEDGSTSIGQILHGGVMWLQRHLGLDEAVSSGRPNPVGQEALMNGAYAASPDDVKGAISVVDPGGKMNHATAMIRALKDGYDYYLLQGDLDRANKYAAGLVQYAVGEASQFGDSAINALRRGNIKAAANYALQGYNQLPNGSHGNPDDIKVDDKGNTTVTQYDTQTGKPIDTHTITPEELYGLALGLKNRSAGWQSILGAAGTQKDANVPATDAAIAAGQTIDQQGTTAAQPAPGAAPSGTSAMPAPGAAPTAPVASGVAPPSTVTGPRGAVTSLPANVDPKVKAAFDSIPDEIKPLAMNVASGESRFSANPDQRKNPSVAGLFQFTVPTWKQVTGQDIAPQDQHVPGKDPRLDPAQAAQAFIKYAQSNGAYIQRVTGKPATPGNIALAHQQGPGGAVALLRADPNTRAVDALAQQRMAAGQRPQVAYNNAYSALSRNGVNPNATAGQAIQHIQTYYGYSGAGGGAPTAVAAAGGAGGAGATAPPVHTALITQAGNYQPPAGATSLERSMQVAAPLQQDYTPPPTPPAQPNLRTYTAADFPGVNAQQLTALLNESKTKNAALQKEYQDQVTQYKTDLATWKKTPGGGASPEPDTKFNGEAFENKLNDIAPVPDDAPKDKNGVRTPTAIDKIWGKDADGNQLWDQIGARNRDTARQIATNIASYDHRITPGDALQISHDLMTVNKQGDPLLYQVHQMPDGRTYRLVMKDGEQYLMDSTRLGELAMARGDINYLAGKPARDKAAALAAANKPSPKGQIARKIGTNILQDIGIRTGGAAPEAAGTRPVSEAGIGDYIGRGLRAIGGPYTGTPYSALPTSGPPLLGRPTVPAARPRPRPQQVAQALPTGPM